MSSTSLKTCSALGCDAAGSALQQVLQLGPVVPRVVDQLHLDVAQGVLGRREPVGGDGEVAADDPGPLGAEPAEVVVEPQGVEVADLAVVEQRLDPGEVGLGVVGQGALLVVGRGRVGRQGVLGGDDPGLQFQKRGGPARPVALDGVARAVGAGPLPGGGPVQLALLTVGGRPGSAGSSGRASAARAVRARSEHLEVQAREFRAPGLHREEGLERLEPLDLDARPPNGR